MPDESPKPPLGAASLLPGEDYYYDGPYLVFTAQYHLKRGTCCNSGCRHCPYASSSNKEDPGNNPEQHHGVNPISKV
jgi:hypothetical protein